MLMPGRAADRDRIQTTDPPPGVVTTPLKCQRREDERVPPFGSISARNNRLIGIKLVKHRSQGKFEPKTMPDDFAVAVKEYLGAKIQQRAPEVTIEKEGKPAPQVINIMDALKKSVQAK